MTRDSINKLGSAIVLAIAIAFAVFSAVANSATYTGTATSYAACDGSTSTTANGRTAREGYVANNFLSFGTWIEMKRPAQVLGRKYFQVMDRGGGAFLIDIWTDDCSWMNSWGSRSVTFRAVPRKELFRGKPYKGWKFKKTSRGARLVWSAAG